MGEYTNLAIRVLFVKLFAPVKATLLHLPFTSVIDNASTLLRTTSPYYMHSLVPGPTCPRTWLWYKLTNSTAHYLVYACVCPLTTIAVSLPLCRVNDLERRIEEIERKATSSTQRCNTMEEKYRSTLLERDRLQASLKESGKELDGLKAQLERLKRQLEDETVERVDLHNRIMSLNEEQAFIRKKHSAVRPHNITFLVFLCDPSFQ